MKLTKNQQFVIVNSASAVGVNSSLIRFHESEKQNQYGSIFQNTLISISDAECDFRIDSVFVPEYESFRLTMKIHYLPANSTPFKAEELYSGNYKSFDWKKLLEAIKTWLYFSKIEIEAINFFKNSVTVPIIPDPSFSSNFHETLDEQAQTIFVDKLEDLKEAILQEIKLSREDADLIRQKMDELILKVDRLNKFDLKTQFYGLMTNLASSILYDHADMFWEIFKGIFSNMALPKG